MTALEFTRDGDWITISDGGVERSIPAWWMDWMPRFDREEGIEVEVVATNTHETAEGDWYASWTIICEDETLDELDDLPKYGTLIKREPDLHGDSEEEA